MTKLPLISTLHEAVFVIVSLLFICSVCSNLIEDSCKKVADKDPNLEYEFCVKFLEETPTTQNATLQGLAIISIKQAIINATAVKTHINGLLNETNSNFDNHTKAGLQDCLELYSGAEYSLQDALKDIMSSDDFNKANIDLSAALDAPSTCEDGFHEDDGKGQGGGGGGDGDGDSPLKTENHIFSQMTLIPLAFLQLSS